MAAELNRDWLRAAVCADVYELYRRRYGIEHFEQEAVVALCESAKSFSAADHPGVPFGAYARQNVRWRLWRAVHVLSRSYKVNRPMPRSDDDWLFDPADHRRTEVDPALKAWCSADYTEQRRCLDMRSRLVLYLRFVAGLTLEECGETLHLTRERVRQLEEKAGARLARFRNGQRLRRQLRTGRPD